MTPQHPASAQGPVHLVINVLGELHVQAEDGTFHRPPDLPRSPYRPIFGPALMAMVLAGDRPADYGYLARATWVAGPSANNQILQNAAAYWRKLLRSRCDALGCEHSNPLPNRRKAYELAGGAVVVADLVELERLAGACRRAAGTGDVAEIARLADAAVELWRGEPFEAGTGPEIDLARNEATALLAEVLASGAAAQIASTGRDDGAGPVHLLDRLVQLVGEPTANRVDSAEPLGRWGYVAACLEAARRVQLTAADDAASYLDPVAKSATGNDRYVLETLARVLRGDLPLPWPTFVLGLLRLPADTTVLAAANRIVAPPTRPLVVQSPPITSFVGRRDQLTFLEGVEPRHLYLIKGEAGLGKTTLLQKAADTARSDDHLQIVCRCATESLPEVVNTYLTSLGTSRLEPLVGLNLANQLHHAQPAGDAPPEQLRATAQRIATQILQRLAASHRVTIYLDDLHVAEGATQTLLTELLRNGVDAVFVATSRPVAHQLLPDLDDAADDAPAGADLLRRIDIRLAPLTLEEVAELLRVELSQLEPESEATVDSAVIGQLHTRTGGNALFLAEVLRYLVEQGALRVVDGVWRLDDDVTFGGALEAFVTGRVGSMSSRAQNALRILACSDPETPYRAARHVLGDELPIVVREAGRIGLIDVDDDQAMGGIRFRHDLLREAVYEMIDPAERWHIHERLGDAVDRRTWAYFAAYHYERAAMLDPRRAVDALAVAGARALAELEIELAADYYHRARRFLGEYGDPDPALEARLLFDEGDCRRRIGQDGHRELLVQAATQAEQHGLMEVAASAAISLADAGSGFHAGYLDTEIAELLNRAANGLPRNALALRARLHAAIAVLISQTERQPRRVAEYEVAERLAEASSDLSTLALVLPAAYWVYDTPDSLDARLIRGRRLISLAATEGTRAEFEGRRLLFSTAVQRGDGTLADQSHQRSRQLLDELPEPACWWAYEYQRTLLTHLRGDLVASEASAFRCQDHAKRAGMPETRQLTVIASQLLAIRDDQGRIGEMALDVIHAPSNLPGVPAWLNGRIVAQLELGDVDRALESFDELASQGFFRNIWDLAWLGGLTLMARHTAEVLSADQAGQVLAEIEPWAGLNSWVASASFGPVDLALGRLALRIGQLDRADRYFADAAAMAERLTSPGFEARSLLGRAEVALERRDVAAAKLAIVDAERLIDGRGMHGIAAMVESTRSRLD